MEQSGREHKPVSRYLLHCLIVFLVVLLLCTVGFFTAMQINEVSVLAEGAMTARENYVMQVGENLEEDFLGRFFTERMIETGQLDELRKAYDDYAISNYNANLKQQSIWTIPGSNSATVKIKESIKNIPGSLKSPGENPDKATKPPSWPNGVYTLKLVRRQGVWLVNEIILTEPEPTAVTTPTPEPIVTPASQ